MRERPLLSAQPVVAQALKSEMSTPIPFVVSERQLGHPGPISPALRIQEAHSWSELQLLSPSWNDLVHRSGRGIFSTLEFCQAWWAAYGEGHGELFCLACLDPDGECVGIAPFWRTAIHGRRVLRLIGDGSDDVDGFDLIVRPGYEEACAGEWLRWLDTHLDTWDILELNSVPAESGALEQLRFAARPYGWVEQSSQVSHRMIELNAEWTTYVASLSKKMRGTISHQLRSMQAQYQVVARRCLSLQEALIWLDKLESWQHVRWTEREIGPKLTVEARRRFYQNLVTALGRRGWLDFWGLFADGEVVAVELGCRLGDQRTGLHPGFDPDMARFSPGLVLRVMMLKELMAEGVARYDFGAGDETYKIRWSNTLKHFAHVRLARPRTRASYEIRVTLAAERIRKRLRNLLPAFAYDSLRFVYRGTAAVLGRRPL